MLARTGRSLLAQRSSPLSWLIARVASFRTNVPSASVVSAADTFSIAASISADKVLELGSNVELLRGLQALSARRGESEAELNSFQRGVIDGVLAKLPREAAPNPTEVGGPFAAVPVSDDDKRAMSSPSTDVLNELLAAFADAVVQFDANHTYNARLLHEAVSRFTADASASRRLTVANVMVIAANIIHIHFRDVGFATRLARRAAELAKTMNCHEAAFVFARLNQIGISDSFAALVSKIESGTAALTTEDCLYVIWGLHASTGINSHALGLVTTVTYELQFRLDQLDVKRLVAIVEVSAAYDLRSSPAVKKFFVKLAERPEQLSDRDILAILVAGHNLKVFESDAELCRTFLTQTTRVARTADVRSLDRYVDIVSIMTLPVDDFMSAVLQRLTNEAIVLSPLQIAAMLNAISSYPPAKGTAAAAALASAAAIKSESFDRESLTQVVLGLAEMGYTGDDLWLLIERLVADKHGFKDGEQLESLLSYVNKDAVRGKRATDCIGSLLYTLLPALSPGTITRIRSRLAELGIEDVMRTMKVTAEAFRRDKEGERRVHQQQRNASKSQNTQRQKKAPFNLNKAMWDLD